MQRRAQSFLPMQRRRRGAEVCELQSQRKTGGRQAIGPDEIRSDQVGSARVESSRVESSRLECGQVRPVRSGEVRSGQARPDQVRSGCRSELEAESRTDEQAVLGGGGCVWREEGACMCLGGRDKEKKKKKGRV